MKVLILDILHFHVLVEIGIILGKMEQEIGLMFVAVIFGVKTKPVYLMLCLVLQKMGSLWMMKIIRGLTESSFGMFLLAGMSLIQQRKCLNLPDLPRIHDR